jgi:RNA polymerase sigma-70 factor (ECF subfamily)
VVALNRAVAVAETGRLEEALELIDAIEGLERYHLLHSARADLLRRLQRTDEAAAAYARALELAHNRSERDFLQSRIQGLQA